MEALTTLIAESATGDMEAYGTLVRQFQNMAHGYAYSILGDSSLSEDVAQEAFLEAYCKLSQLRTPDAFPGWLRRIVFKHCDRIMRRKRVSTVTLEHAAEVAGNGAPPDLALEKEELRTKVLAALRSLPEDERTVATLFYISGHSHKEVAAFLDVPASTVKSRLHTARKKMRGRMFTMIRDTLKKEGVDERFSKKVIDALLAQPRLLEITSHPVQEVYEKIVGALPDYETAISGSETVDEAEMMNPWCLQFAYHSSKDTILRTETMGTVFDAASRRPAPVRLIAADRVFQALEDKHPIRHELNVLCVEAGADEAAMKRTARTMLESVFGSLQLEYEATTFHWFTPCYSVKAGINGQTISLGGCGVMTAKTLEQFGFDPTQVGGFVIVIGKLEQLAMQKHGIKNVEDLWREPYV